MLERTCKQCGETKPFDVNSWYVYKGRPSGRTCRVCYNIAASLKQQQKRATPTGLQASREYRNAYYAATQAKRKALLTVPKKRGRPRASGPYSPVPLIYSLTWAGTLARYVGQTTNLVRRLQRHKIAANNWCLQAAYDLHGVPTVTILEYVPNPQNLIARERFWIEKLDSNNQVTDGLNIL